MSFLAKRLADLLLPDIQQLVDDRVREGAEIDYKAALEIENDEQKREFLADVSSFANTIGGDMLVGVEEERDAAGRSTGIPEKIAGLPKATVDKLMLRADNLLRDSIAPRIPTVRFHPVDCGPEKQVLLIGIGSSWMKPHMITFRGAADSHEGARPASTTWRIPKSARPSCLVMHRRKSSSSFILLESLK